MKGKAIHFELTDSLSARLKAPQKESTVTSLSPLGSDRHTAWVIGKRLRCRNATRWIGSPLKAQRQRYYLQHIIRIYLSLSFSHKKC